MKNDNSNKIILDLCGGTGSWSLPYKKAGYDVRLITLPKYDVRNYVAPKNVYGILAAPPCTEFAISKAKWERKIDMGMEIVNACLRIIEDCNPVFWALENPAGVLGKYLGKAVFSFQPYEYGDGWTKRTMLWGKFNKPQKIYKKFEDCPKIEGLYVRPNRKTPSIAFNHKSHKKFIRSFDSFNVDSDAAFRAITPQGFAQAFYEANK